MYWTEKQQGDDNDMDPNTIDEGRRLDTLDANGDWVYPSGAASGHTEVVLPSLPGSPYGEERMLAKDFGMHVIGKIEASMNRQGYMRSGAQQNPAETLAHYVATARGSKLLHPDAVEEMSRLAKEFQEVRASERDGYFTSMVKPFLLGLAPKRRPK